MPLSATLDPTGTVRIVTYVGEINNASLVRGFEEVWNAPWYVPAMAELNDLSGLTEVNVTTDGMRALAYAANEFHRDEPEGRVAIYAPAVVTFGMARMYEALVDAEPDRYRVFRELGPARAWVGLSPD